MSERYMIDPRSIESRRQDEMTIGLIDTILNCSHLLTERYLDSPQVKASLRRLLEDEDLGYLRLRGAILDAAEEARRALQKRNS